ncbi:leucyl/phenylalanyl-tRNA--protein transferase [Pseudomarimonas salicorniae]|uniref:Leucyl/phenylalanyl-tRNA--protein transferase n=1 Tax=Pseudomarimonas salicorniae TaxID=2933270 RepID=A0ABT0GET1_9GAMM|nr:leucyl/phenylalanyl-tRNA--protein transferase [Lysobacter sp. CAU 1642]MCK7593050.1 leucyl/phenylalanyl-tRNA--protein transferase [Lysobacter sp. CAU 1642]
MIRLPLLGEATDAPFPPPQHALREPNGLLAFGGDLSPGRLVRAYASGIFPWYSAGEPILWWSPDPRMVVRPTALHLSRRFRRSLRACPWTVSINRDFAAVIHHCAALPRPGQGGTWITPEMTAAYVELHRLGWAHSVEVREGEELVGGIYGVGIGRAFFGESMFSRRSGTSKLAIAALCRALTEQGVELLDGQVESGHLATLGFAPIPRRDFLAQLEALCKPATPLRLSESDIEALQPERMT